MSQVIACARERLERQSGCSASERKHAFIQYWEHLGTVIKQSEAGVFDIVKLRMYVYDGPHILYHYLQENCNTYWLQSTELLTTSELQSTSAVHQPRISHASVTHQPYISHPCYQLNSQQPWSNSASGVNLDGTAFQVYLTCDCVLLCTFLRFAFVLTTLPSKEAPGGATHQVASLNPP